MTVATAVAIAALAASAYGASEQNKAGKAAAKAQEHGSLASAKEQRINAMLSRVDAERIDKQSKIEADKIREVAIEIRGQQEAQQAISGAVVNSGSHLAVTEETTRRAEADALATVMEGIYGNVNKSLSARYLEQSSNATLLSGGLSAGAALQSSRAGVVTTLGQAATSAFSFYKTYGTATKTTPTPAPSTPDSVWRL